jgi:hypothetical protein
MTPIARLLELSQDSRFARQLRDFLRKRPDTGDLSPQLVHFIESYEEQSTDQDSFLKFLYENSDNRGIMSRLSAGLSSARSYDADPILARFDGTGGSPRAKARRYVGAWFATYPSKADKGDVGTLCRSLLSSEEAKSLDSTGEPGPMTKRFLNLLQAEGDEVYKRLSSFVFRAKSDGTGKRINYSQWLKDLEQWAYRADRVKERWAASYWAADFAATQVADVGETDSGAVTS